MANTTKKPNVKAEDPAKAEVTGVEIPVETKTEPKKEKKVTPEVRVKFLFRWLKPDGTTAEIGEILSLDSKIADNLIKYKIAIKEE